MRNRLCLFVAILLLTVLPVVAQDSALALEILGSYKTNTFDEGGAEIVAHHPASQTLYVVNGATNTIDLLNIADPAAPTLAGQIDVTQYGDAATHVDVFGDLVAVAIEADPNTDPGKVAFFTPAGEFISAVTVGALPDQLTFTPDGSKVLTANEGQPSDDYSVDPEGSVSIIDLAGGAAALTDASVTTVGFAEFNADGARAAELDAAVRIYGPNATVAQDLEPEYVAVSPDGSTAFVTLQENNALAVIDIAAGTVTAIKSLGFKDHSVAGNGIDASNEDGAINIANWPVLGMYQPDALYTYSVGDTFYLISANEGDTRDYEDSYSEEGEISEMTLDASAFPNAADLQPEDQLGKLEVTLANGDTDGDGDYDVLYVPGGRSISIWASDGTLVYDSGDQIEQITAQTYPDDFNATNDENGSFDDRSDNKGPEPEGIALGVISERTYAFVGLERIGGVMVFDITDPMSVSFVTYVNNRDFAGDAEAGTAGDLGPEGLIFIPAADSPNGADLLVVANEISGSTTIYQIKSA